MNDWFNLSNEILFWAFNGYIVYFAIAQWLKLKKKTNNIVIELEESNKQFKSKDSKRYFAENFSSIDATVLQFESLNHPWHEFTEHLIAPSVNDKDQVFMNTLSPTTFFSSESIVSQKMDLRWVNSVPGILTALGILGTFTGLSIGVYFAQAKLTGGLDEVQEGLRILLEGASLAFVTSFLGIIGSLFFSYQEKKRFKIIETLISEFCDHLERSCKFVSKEQLARQQLHVQHEQLKVLDSFSNDLAISLGNMLEGKFSNQIGGGFDKVVECLVSLKDVQSNFSNDLMKNVADKITGGLSSVADQKTNQALESMRYMQDSMVNQMDRMLAAQTQMQDSTKKLIDEISSGLIMSQSTLTNDLVETMNKLQGDFGSLASNLTLKIDSSISNMTDKMNAVNEAMIKSQQSSLETFDIAIKGLSSHLSNAAQASSEHMVGNINESATKLSELVEGLSHVVTNSNEITVKGVNEAMNSLNKTINSFGSNVVNLNAYADKQKELAVINDKLIGDFKIVVSGNKEVSDKFIQASESLGSASNNILSLNSSLENYSSSVARSVLTFQQINEQTHRHWNDYVNRYQGIDASVAGMFQKLDLGTKEYGKLVHNYMSELTTSSEKVVTRFATAVEELSEAIDDLAEKNPKKVS